MLYHVIKSFFKKIYEQASCDIVRPSHLAKLTQACKRETKAAQKPSVCLEKKLSWLQIFLKSSMQKEFIVTLQSNCLIAASLICVQVFQSSDYKLTICLSA